MSGILKSYRIFKDVHLETANTGYGASLFPGRWNHRNVPVLYSSATLSLSCLEIVANANVPGLLENYLFVEYQFKESLLGVTDIKHLPPDWMASPPSNITRDIGDKWIKSNKSVVLRVPSSIIPRECNYLINPNHIDFKSIVIRKAEKFMFDQRIVGGN
jgi:RES domain-containing protein